ncbi:MAG: DUF1015 domain-containing protein [Coriobacteriia bacterium]|nr:DUF1015 domain-containing protein [Coriobacteriia bacterium]
MARVRPFAAYRYSNAELDISLLAAPPYDVISPAQRESLLARDPHNVVALELPSGATDPAVPGNRYDTGRATWTQWRESGVLDRDAEPTLYVLEQRFVHDGHPVCRRAFIAEVALEPFDAGVVLPHERTLPKALGDRFELIKATGANLSQVFGLFNDPSGSTDVLFDTVTADEPIATATDDDGVVSTLWATTDSTVSGSLTDMMADEPIFIADGHHRYTVALAYRDLRRMMVAEHDDAPADPLYDYVMMALVNMNDPGLLVLPTHRIADAPGGFDGAAFYMALSKHFVVEDTDAFDSAALDGIPEPAFLMQTRVDDHPKLIRLRNDVDLDVAISSPHSSAWKRLDVAVLQELILDRLLDVHPDRPATLDRLRFAKNAHEAFRMVGEHDVAFILRATPMEQLREVATAGETMPQKSTYFYPKLLSGLVFRDAE